MYEFYMLEHKSQFLQTFINKIKKMRLYFGHF